MMSADVTIDSGQPKDTVDLLISANEINNHHGVGIFLQRLFSRGENFCCLRSTTMYGGEEPFGRFHLELRSRFFSPPAAKEKLALLLAGHRIRRILSVPYFREDFVHAVAAREITGAPLCTFIMDDQNIFAPNVGDVWIDRLLDVSDLRLGISAEMCAAYEAKFGYPLHLMPPVLTERHDCIPNYWTHEAGEAPRCAMIGNVWTQSRLNQLRGLLRVSEVNVDWYGNGPFAGWLDGKTEEWAEDNLHVLGFLPEDDLVASLASYPLILLPSGTADANDDNPAFSRLSLPSRLLFIHSRTDTPVLVLGSPRTAAGHFVTRLGTGGCSALDPQGFRAEIERLTESKTHAQCRRAIRQIAASLVLPNAGEWLWQSLAARRTLPAPFDRVFPAIDETRRKDIIANIIPFSYDPSAAPAQHGFDPATFAYSRIPLLPVLENLGLVGRVTPEERELTEFLCAAAVHQVVQLSDPESDVLFLGETPPACWKHLKSKPRTWLLRNFKVGLGGLEDGAAPIFDLADPTTDEPSPKVPETFAIIWSAGFADQVGQDPGAQSRFHALCERFTAPRGWNVHTFSAVLHPQYFWVHPLYNHLRQRALGHRPWPGLEDVLADTETFFMSQTAYDRYWHPSIQKSYEDFGRVLWLSIAWQQLG